ncbi:FHA domain-containing protein [Mucilaginibacter gracilis]|uniref:FHA domain-containing protein n=1 Tax=Mucilaginibacter gracilis TaxID=423350 RepID=A0A495J1X9_9SPHI|nr:FHA domain-containing protein [Mucilaginibacter gracilis]RKR82304.1 FHA domain-containing protein [Mucilaginibacter gracilis]
MTDTIKCLDCTADIEMDSAYCDQCGKQIYLCETCGKPGNQKFCEYDGGNLVAAKPGTTQTVNSQNLSQVVATAVPQISTPQPAATVNSNGVIPALKLINHTLNLDIDLKPGEVFGRNTGPYVDKLQTYSAISGKHLIFRYEAVGGWSFEDLGSTNGTKYSTTNMDWNNVVKCVPGKTFVIEDGTYILVANIEFAVKTDQSVATGNAVPTNGTQHL